MEYPATTKRAKFRFIALYVLGLVLIFVVVSSFWQKRVDDVREAKAAEAILVADSPSPEVENLKRAVAEKDQRIADLEAAVQKASASGSGVQQNAGSVAPDEKDKTIASLQTQLKEKEAALRAMSTSVPATTSTSGDTEWKQKYSSLKASYDKVSANEKSLKTAYKTVADDNKRLITQLQSMKKG